jgi:hypothetical protein
MMKPSPDRSRLRPLIEELEPRVLMSADLQCVLVDPSLGNDERAADSAAHRILWELMEE